MVSVELPSAMLGRALTLISGVTLGELKLSLENGRETENGTITDDVIEIPKTANIGEEITVTICKTINDSEVDGLSWIILNLLGPQYPHLYVPCGCCC